LIASLSMALATEIIRSVAREYRWPESKGKE
jgi:hypothetical protein